MCAFVLPHFPFMPIIHTHTHTHKHTHSDLFNLIVLLFRLPTICWAFFFFSLSFVCVFITSLPWSLCRPLRLLHRKILRCLSPSSSSTTTITTPGSVRTRERATDRERQTDREREDLGSTGAQLCSAKSPSKTKRKREMTLKVGVFHDSTIQEKWRVSMCVWTFSTPPPHSHSHNC